MNNEGAIFVLKTLRDMHLGAVNSDALTMAIAALEKQEPRKPDFHTNGLSEYFSCPKCGNSDRGLDDYCNKCGQRLSWEENAE